MQEIKQVVCVRPGTLEHQKSNFPIRKPGEALLKIERIGICGTDLHAFGGNQPFFTYPRILGHELAAKVIEVDENPENIGAGDWVTVIPYQHCGNCIACSSGKPNCCENIRVYGVHIDGGMREYVCIPLGFILPVHGLNPNEIALIEPLAIGQHALERAQIQQTDQVVVIGCGPIGIGLIKLALDRGAKVLAVDSNPNRVSFVREILGVQTVNTMEGQDLKSIKAYFDGNLASVVFDATGNKQAMESGHHFMRHGGTYVLVGLNKGNLSFSHPEIHAKETSLLCSRNATRADFLEVIAYLKKKEFPVSHFITHSISFDTIPEYMNQLTSPNQGVMKAMIQF